MGDLERDGAVRGDLLRVGLEGLPQNSRRDGRVLQVAANRPQSSELRIATKQCGQVQSRPQNLKKINRNRPKPTLPEHAKLGISKAHISDEMGITENITGKYNQQNIPYSVHRTLDRWS